ncbi:probable phenylacetyl-CoA ligase [Serendipita indica DSM 11827]|uniref:Probable phenylacetyl-CoA ligase n=1 Tax=Serendipita indica (strain DSM 11827) TaxID=1109443 RepID=G4TYV9_SERID|nr:probable phenylacetyl-CoA ligase [Serendipita indica DSM 11827]
MVHVKSLLPEPPSAPIINISTFLLEREGIPDHILFINSLTGEAWTRARFIDRVRRLQCLLPTARAQGGFDVHSSEMVAVFSENCIEYVALMHALWALAIPFAPCSAYATSNELVHCLRITGASTIFCHANRLETTLEAAKVVGIPTSKIYILDGETTREFKSIAQLINSASFPRTLPSKAVPVKKDQLAFVLFSSGTTGLPKAVALSHNNVIHHTFQRLGWLQSMLQSASPPPMAPSGGLSVTLGFLPIFHTYGLHSFCITPFFLPGTVVLMPRWDTNKGLELIPKHKVTTIVAVPSVIHQISRSPKLAETDMSSVFSLASGAAYLSPSLSKKLSGQVGDKTMSAISMICEGQLGGKWRYIEGCSGGLLPGMEARTVREDGTEAEYGETGELWLKGGNIALGYLGNPKATAETFVDGWLRTGDLFKIDQEGYFWYQDRGKDTLKVSGMQVSPMEIEEALLRHPGGLVQDVAVAGVDIALRGSTVVERVPRAWVVLTDQGVKAEPDSVRLELEAWIQKQLSRYKWLKGGIAFVDQIPKSATGKVLRRQLVEEHSRQNPVHVSSRL